MPEPAAHTRSLLITLTRALIAFRFRAAPTPAPTRARRARAAVGSGVVAFVLATVGLAVVVETVRPQWRDPEYGYRRDRVRGWVREHPDRSLVLVFGSSRVEEGISPSAMGFSDAPGCPLVFNFGYRGATLLGVWLHVTRLLDDGVKPGAILVVISAFELQYDGPAEEQLGLWAPRLSGADVRWLAPYTKDPAAFRRALGEARRNPWAAHREPLISDLCPRWWPDNLRGPHFAWTGMDRYGFVPLERAYVTDEIRRRAWKDVLDKHVPGLNERPVGATTDRALRDLVGRCRAEGVAVALAWAPESPTYRALYTPDGRATAGAYTRALTTELELPVFPAPDLDEDDFMDGIHLLRGGAQKYSRWFADTHLKPWLARVLK
jgi:hypothetical protein